MDALKGKGKGKGKGGKNGKGRGKDVEGGKAAPAQAVRRVRFYFDHTCPDNVNSPHAELCDRHRDRIVPITGFEPNYFRAAILRYAVARSAAIDLAEGVGLLGPEPDSLCFYDHELWGGVEQVSEYEDRRRPVVWCSTYAVDIRLPLDGYASYGRRYGPAGVEYTTDLRDALEWY